MRIVICEDEVVQQRVLIGFIESYFSPAQVRICVFDHGEGLLKDYEKGNRYDLVFLDMRLGQMDGIEVAYGIRSYDSLVPIVINTSLIEYAAKGYHVHANGFLLKPIQKTEFDNLLNRIMRETTERRAHYYRITAKDQQVQFLLSEVDYVDCFGRKVGFHLGERVYEETTTLKQVEAVIGPLGFVKVYRSVLVNVKKIYRIKAKSVVLYNQVTLPLTQMRYKAVYDAFTSDLTRRIR